jgi:large subunit ribosomal protein L22
MSNTDKNKTKKAEKQISKEKVAKPAKEKATKSSEDITATSKKTEAAVNSAATKSKDVEQLEATAFAKCKAIKTSVQKLNLVAGLIRGMKAEQALLQLRFSKKKVARDVYHVLNSAIANAENNFGLDVDRLYVSRVMVGKAFVMKRFRARARGRGARILKPFSNVSIYVTEKSE